MRINERHKKILALLNKEDNISVAELAQKLDVSLVTIRKDLSHLESQKKLYRTHGKAVLINPYTYDTHVSEKEKRYPDEKRKIGLFAAEMIDSNDTIIIGSGTTMHFFARELEAKDKLTVITSSVQVTSILATKQNIEIILLGGFVRNSSVSTVGSYTEKMIENFSCSKFFLGIDGINSEFGLTTTNMEEASLNKKMIKSSQKVIVLADSSKFGRRGFSRICHSQDIDQIITDKGISQHYIKELTDNGIEVSIVE